MWPAPRELLRVEEDEENTVKRTAVDQLASSPEGCESGRIGRSRKPLCVLRTVGSNPTPSAKTARAGLRFDRLDSFGRRRRAVSPRSRYPISVDRAYALGHRADRAS